MDMIFDSLFYKFYDQESRLHTLFGYGKIAFMGKGRQTESEIPGVPHAIKKHGLSSTCRRFATTIAAFALLGFAGCGLSIYRAQLCVPGVSWRRISPKEALFDEQRLEALSNRLEGDGCIVYRGRMFHTWGDVSRLHDIASAAKPFYTHFTLKAFEEGLIPSLEERVMVWVNELNDLNEDLEFKDRRITFRHLLDQTSGYGLREPPGKAFGYNDFQTGLLVWTLFRRVYECGFDGADRELLHHRLGTDLLFEDEPTFRHAGSWPGRLVISARDLARFGHLYLMNGQWRGRSVLGKDLVRLALNSAVPETVPRTEGLEAERFPGAHSIGGGFDQKGHAGAHSFFWWVNRQTADGNRFLPDATPRTFLASGSGGRFVLIVIPEYHMVVVWLDAFHDEKLSPFDEIGRHWVNEAVREVLDARR